MAIRVFFIRDASKFPVACVATEAEGETISYALSVRNPIDAFDRKRGRSIAESRLGLGKIHGTVPREPGACREILLDIAGDEHLPKRVREAAGYRASLCTGGIHGKPESQVGSPESDPRGSTSEEN